ncbi:hypothetical protein PCANC_13342 [Puccinia coronata f. sp. avenae]|uniref:pectin lyase n=1 Tax=Puccinia coronata f. sp. avenae TaxID=200324 RepID=A0A2N5STV4_9BASI|nr:hypothetical protein PCANC_13342 [Puccinia coronata f. sp. avenae]PLW23824.1 hypothetical protein PCASD_10640 [Puccinia coronata f. sp. avenae]
MLADIFPKSVNALSTINHGMYGRSPQAPTARPPGTNQIKNPSPGAQPGGKTPSKDGKPVPFGFGAKVTGGGNAIPQTPKNIAELQAWLTDKVPRVILINRVYDFTTSSGNVTAAACQPWKPCPNGLQVQTAKNYKDWCSREKKVASNLQISLQASALDPIKVSSHKTLLGVGAKAVLKGKGLILYKVQNVIVQNVHITWLNPQAVWGGDALTLQGARNIWIDHCSFSNIGRQMIVSHGKSGEEANVGVTISNNLFSGKTQWSSRCNNMHYWTAFFTGANDEITMARNCIDSTSGRSPKTGGSGNPKVILHYYNNLHTNIQGGVFQAGRGSDILAEGNVFKNVKTQNNGDAKTQDGGRTFVPFRDEDSNLCSAVLGRPCVANVMLQSSNYNWGQVTQTVNIFKGRPEVVKAGVLPAAKIQNGVPGLCGTGQI